MSDYRPPRGIRNHNPGNIRWGVPYAGLVAPEKRTDPDFCQFVDAWHGIRALALNLLSYQILHGCTTIDDFVSRWAPPAKNDTAAYIADVSEFTDWPANEPIDLSALDGLGKLMKLSRAIIHHENGSGALQRGHWYPDTEVRGAVIAAIQEADRHA